MKHIIIQFSRIFVGVLFIFSGLIKLNDPVGFAFKLEEYFGVFNLNFLMPLALSLALFLLFLEVVLGVMLLIGYAPKITVSSLLAIIVFFTFLTFYSAYYNKVTDCGCFGDAIPLTPWQSFYKDLVLLALILILFFGQKSIKPLFENKLLKAVTLVSLLGCMFLAYHVLYNLPLKDFRAYKVGTNITQGMSIPEGAPKSEIDMVFVYLVNGEPQEFTTAQIMAGDYPEDAEFVERKDKIIKLGYVPPIKDFTMLLDEIDYKDTYLEEPKVLMITSYDLTKAHPSGLARLKDLFEEAIKNGYEVMGLTGSGQEVINKTIEQYELPFDFFFCDPTAVKTIERANPSIVLLNSGTITQKVHWRNLDKINW